MLQMHRLAPRGVVEPLAKFDALQEPVLVHPRNLILHEPNSFFGVAVKIKIEVKISPPMKKISYLKNPISGRNETFHLSFFLE